MTASLSERRHPAPILRFVGLFLAGFVAFQVAYYQWVVPSGAFEAYLGALTRISAGVLRGLGMGVGASGSSLAGRYFMSVAVGCDGLQAMAILVIAVLAFPGSWKAKLVGASSGIGILLVLNTLRIVTLYWVGASEPQYFQLLHVHAWPALLIAAAVVTWLSWAMWANTANRQARP